MYVLFVELLFVYKWKCNRLECSNLILGRGLFVVIMEEKKN